MAEHEPRQDGFLSLIGGMHGGRAPDLLGEQQYARGVNTSVRNGLIRTRPGFNQILSVANIEKALFKGGTTYYDSSGDYLVFAFGEYLYQYELSTGALTEHGAVIDSRATRLFFCQAHKYLVIQDDVVGSSYADKAWPIILEGTTNISASYDAERASNPENMLPKGQMMAYGHGRLFVAVDWVWNGEPGGAAGTGFDLLPRTNFIAGDIFQAWDPDNILRAEENQGAGGGALSLTNELGLITAMTFQRNVQTGTGHGPLVVFAERGAATYQVDLPRELSGDAADWGNAGLGKTLFQTSGMNAPLSIASVNNDVMYRAVDGIRTLRQTVSEAQASGLDLSVEDISEEVRLWLTSSKTLQGYASGAFADNRYLLTAEHGDEDYPFWWRGLISFDTSVTTSLGQSMQPVYDGIWTGLEFFQVVRARKNGIEQHYVFARNESGDAGIYELTDGQPDRRFDLPDSRPICRVETGIKVFQSAFSIKELEYIQLQLREVRGTVDLTAYYRTDGLKLWKQMGTARVVESGQDGRTHPIRIPLFDTQCDPTGAPFFLHVGNGFQFAIEWTGICTIAMAQFRLKMLDKDEYQICEEMQLNTVPGEGLVVLDDFEYQI